MIRSDYLYKTNEINQENEDAMDEIFKVLDKYDKKGDISSMFDAWIAFKTFYREESCIQPFLNKYDK